MRQRASGTARPAACEVWGISGTGGESRSWTNSVQNGQKVDVSQSRERIIQAIILAFGRRRGGGRERTENGDSQPASAELLPK